LKFTSDNRNNRSADCRLEPQGPPASLTRIPDLYDLLRIGGRLALGLGALRVLGRSGSGAIFGTLHASPLTSVLRIAWLDRFARTQPVHNHHVTRG
jgi:hypothetical protein